jgi:hypothetical protein
LMLACYPCVYVSNPLLSACFSSAFFFFSAIHVALQKSDYFMMIESTGII